MNKIGETKAFKNLGLTFAWIQFSSAPLSAFIHWLCEVLGERRPVFSNLKSCEANLAIALISHVFFVQPRDEILRPHTSTSIANALSSRARMSVMRTCRKNDGNAHSSCILPGERLHASRADEEPLHLPHPRTA